MTPHDYQLRAIDFCLKTRNTLVVMKMGLGKTLVALKVIEATKRPALVLGPLKPITNTWPEEIEKWAPNLSYTILHGPQKDQKFYLRKDITLLNYDGLKWFYQKCLKSSTKLRRYILVADESSMLKDQSTTRFTLMKKLQPLLLPVRLFLTATPVDEGLIGLWSQMYLLDNGKRLGKSFSSYRNKYFVSTGPPRHITTVLPHATKIISEKVKDVCFALDNKDYIKMPDVISNVIPVKLSSDVMRKYKKLEEDFVHEFPDGDMAISRSNNTLVNKLRQFVSGALYTTGGGYQVVHKEKALMLKDVLEGLQGRNTLVAINFRFEVDMIRESLGYKVPVIHGGQSNDESSELVKAWNRRELPVLLCHPLSISHGMNLQSGGESIVWYTLPWGIGPHNQLIGRLARQGQEADKVIVHYILAKDTVDYLVLKVLLKKDAKQENFFHLLKEGL